MILIADAGGNKTDWAILDNQSVYRFESSGFNAKTHALDPFLAQIPIELVQDYEITKVYFYAAGVTSKLESTQIASKLQQVFRAKEVEVFSDVLGSARAVLGNEKGFVGILGTGSAGAFYNGRFITKRVPSLGYILGDEGSGVQIGSAFLQSYLRNQLPEDLSNKFREKFGELDESIVLEKVYREPKPNLFLSSFTTICSENIEHPFVKQLVLRQLELYFNAFVLPDFDQIKQAGFTGSVAAGFHNLLKEVATKHQLSISSILKSPIEGLISYHRYA